MSWYYERKRKTSSPSVRHKLIMRDFPLLHTEVTERGTVTLQHHSKITFPPGTPYRVILRPYEWQEQHRFRLIYRFGESLYPDEKVIFFGKVTKRHTIRVPKKYLPEMLGSCRFRFTRSVVFLEKPRFTLE